MTDIGTGRLLAIDYGLARIGLAVCDASRLIARELTIINRRSKKEDFVEINAIAVREGVVGVVVGLPIDHDAAPDQYTQADRVRLWASRYAETTDLPLTFYDEQLSSEDAKELARLQKRASDDPLDDLAARVILQRYLDAVREGFIEAAF